jgi:hypothetical protein
VHRGWQLTAMPPCVCGCAGGSSYLAAKINEAKDLMLGKKRGGRSPF